MPGKHYVKVAAYLGDILIYAANLHSRRFEFGSDFAELFVDGVSKGEKIYHRDSMGGFGAGYKGSCSVLGRTSKALGKDFSVWLKELEAEGV